MLGATLLTIPDAALPALATLRLGVMRYSYGYGLSALTGTAVGVVLVYAALVLAYTRLQGHHGGARHGGSGRIVGAMPAASCG